MTMLARSAVLLYVAAKGANARSFSSRDYYVRGVIAQCENQTVTTTAVPGEILCRMMLRCILNNVKPAIAARWSAGSSILAFIPTIAALMSNSIDEVTLAAEESPALALALALFSLTLFIPRFQETVLPAESTEAIRQKLHQRLANAFEADARFCQFRRRQRIFLLGILALLLLGGCAAIWYPALMIVRNGIVVFSCGLDIHVPMWIALAQATATLNVLLRRYTVETTTISLDGESSAESPARTPWPRVVVLRHSKSTNVANTIRISSSLIGMGLYAYATGVLGGMTMFPASDAIRAMVMFATVAGLGRIVCAAITSQFGRWRSTIVIDIAADQMMQVQEMMKAELHTNYGALL